MHEIPSTFDKCFHDSGIEDYGNSILQYSQLGKTDMFISHLSLGGAGFGKYKNNSYLCLRKSLLYK